MNSENNIAVKAPTPTDLKIFDYLKTGKSINNIDALNLFRTTGLRDSIYRLRKAGYGIESETIYYQTSDGRTKHYVNYSISKKVA
jgi:hypothetical protein